jgi:hypothetical protein
MGDHIADYLADLPAGPIVKSGGEQPANQGMFPVFEEQPTDTDASMDEILERIDPGGGDEESAPSTGADEPQDDPEAQDDSEAGGEAEEASSDEGGGEAEASATPEGYEDALRALRRDGWTDSQIDAMDPSMLTELGLKARDRQSHSDDLARQNAELRRDSSGDSKEESTAQVPTDDPPRDLTELVEPLREEIGDAADAVVPLIRQVIADAIRAERTQLQELGEAVPAMQRMVLQSLTDQARTQLTREYPGLESADTWASVQNRMGSLAKTGDYQDPTSLMRDACRLEIGAPTATNQKTRKSRSSSKQPTKPKASRRAPLSPDEKDNLILAMLDNGASPAEARARADRG